MKTIHTRHRSTAAKSANQRCEHCASHDVRWFTPPRYGPRAAVLLCMACERLTIVPPRPRAHTNSEALAA